MARTALLAAVAAAMLAAAHAQPAGAPPAVPGVCTGSTSAGIGCGYDATQIDVGGLTLNPKRPVVTFDWCDAECYTPAHWYDPQCDYCNYQLEPYNTTFSVPKNVFVMEQTQAGGCYEGSTNDHVDDYMDLVGNTVGHDGWFHSWSKTTVNYYHMYYERDDSQALHYKFLIWHQITLFPESGSLPKPSMFLTIAENALPDSYDNETYGNFVEEWGTHYMDNAYMGGSALMTQYFHSCFLEQMGGQYVYSQSSSSFFGIFNSADAKKSGFNKTDGKYKQYSSSSIKLIGGDSDKYGTLNWTNPLKQANVEDWEQSVKDNMMPLTYSFTPIYQLFTDSNKARNMEHHLTMMGAAIEDQQKSLVSDLIPKDPKFSPPWCHFSPHPPALAQEEDVQAAASRKLLGALPGCPALPSVEETVARTELRFDM